MAADRQDGGRPVHAGHRARLRERFRREGLSAFSEHEVLELLLTYAIPQRDVNPLAHALIERFGSLSAVLEASEQELLMEPGIGPKAASLLMLMPPLLGCYQRSALGERPALTDLTKARAYCVSLFHGLYEECIYLISLDQGSRVIRRTLLRRGTVNEVALYPREVVETALRDHACAVLLAHNHPGGTCDPSRADYRVTKDVVHALQLVGVRVADHLVVAGDSVFSMMSSLQGGSPAQEVRYAIPAERSVATACGEEPRGLTEEALSRAVRETEKEQPQ